jgi:putative DNA primase/helicase
MKNPDHRGVAGRGAGLNGNFRQTNIVRPSARHTNINRQSSKALAGRSLGAAEIGQALGGRKSGGSWMACCPAHDDREPSLSICDTEDGMVLVNCFAGCDPMQVIAALRGLGLWPNRRSARPVLCRIRRASTGYRPHQDESERIEAALAMWHAAVPAQGTLVETYLATRGIRLEEDVAGEAIRFHPALKFDGLLVGAMVALFRDLRTNTPCGIHRTFIDTTGQKLGRKMLGRVRDAAIKLDADEAVTLGLHIGEGIETSLAARLAGFRPVWALGSVNAISTFLVLPGIEAVTVLGEVGDGGANHRAAEACAARWGGVGCDVLVVLPQVGKDLNDVWREVAP